MSLRPAPERDRAKEINACAITQLDRALASGFAWRVSDWAALLVPQFPRGHAQGYIRTTSSSVSLERVRRVSRLSESFCSGFFSACVLLILFPPRFGEFPSILEDGRS